MGGIHRYVSWKKPILSDSGGFQIYSLSPLVKGQARRRAVLLSFGRDQDIRYTGRCDRHPKDLGHGHHDAARLLRALPLG